MDHGCSRCCQWRRCSNDRHIHGAGAPTWRVYCSQQTECGEFEVPIISRPNSVRNFKLKSRARIKKLLVHFDSEVRKRTRRDMMQTSESGHYIAPGIAIS